MVQQTTDPSAGHSLFLTRIACVEVAAAVTRRSRVGNLAGANARAILAQFRYDILYQYNILEITPSLLIDAERLAEIHGLRGYDAVQLAASLILRQNRMSANLPDLIFVGADVQLNQAAQTEGMIVDNSTNPP